MVGVWTGSPRRGHPTRAGCRRRGIRSIPQLVTDFGDVLIPPCRLSVKRFNPMESRRRLTTSRAACFSATNSTVRPAARLRAIKLVIVLDLPVPGGPSRTNVLPAADSSTARNCDPSASEAGRLGRLVDGHRFQIGLVARVIAVCFAGPKGQVLHERALSERIPRIVEVLPQAERAELANGQHGGLVDAEIHVMFDETTANRHERRQMSTPESSSGGVVNAGRFAFVFVAAATPPDSSSGGDIHRNR